MDTDNYTVNVKFNNPKFVIQSYFLIEDDNDINQKIDINQNQNIRREFYHPFSHNVPIILNKAIKYNNFQEEEELTKKLGQLKLNIIEITKSIKIDKLMDLFYSSYNIDDFLTKDILDESFNIYYKDIISNLFYIDKREEKIENKKYVMLNLKYDELTNILYQIFEICPELKTSNLADKSLNYLQNIMIYFTKEGPNNTDINSHLLSFTDKIYVSISNLLNANIHEVELSSVDIENVNISRFRLSESDITEDNIDQDSKNTQFFKEVFSKSLDIRNLFFEFFTITLNKYFIRYAIYLNEDSEKPTLINLLKLMDNTVVILFKLEKDINNFLKKDIQNQIKNKYYASFYKNNNKDKNKIITSKTYLIYLLKNLEEFLCFMDNEFKDILSNNKNIKEFFNIWKESMLQKYQELQELFLKEHYCKNYNKIQESLDKFKKEEQRILDIQIKKPQINTSIATEKLQEESENDFNYFMVTALNIEQCIETIKNKSKLDNEIPNSLPQFQES